MLGAVVLAAVASVVTEQWFLGDEPLFRVPPYHLAHGAELLAYAALGLIGGGVSLRVREVGRGAPAAAARAAAVDAGICSRRSPACFVGVIGAALSAGDGRRLRVHRSGDARSVTAGACCWRSASLKVVATTASFVSGTPGGLFAPTLFIGAMLGGAVCAIERLVAPGHHRPDRRVRAGRHGDAVRRHHPRADDVGVHDRRRSAATTRSSCR